MSEGVAPLWLDAIELAYLIEACERKEEAIKETLPGPYNLHLQGVRRLIGKAKMARRQIVLEEAAAEPRQRR